MESSELLGQLTADSREVERSIFRQKQHLPPLVKGKAYWVYFADQWRICRVVRRLPGDVYKARFSQSVIGCYDIVICSNNYGGELK